MENKLELPKSSLVELNDVNGASIITYNYANKVLKEFEGNELIGVQMGIAYGGGVDRMARLWGERGKVYGFDTFENAHPVHLAVVPNEREATCMDHWYNEEVYGKSKLSYDYQKSNMPGNVELIKGEVHELSCMSLPHIHYAFLDMDLIVSMKNGYAAVKDKIVKGGYLLLHDVVSPTNLPRLVEWFYKDILVNDKDMWQIDGIFSVTEDLAVLKRI